MNHLVLSPFNGASVATFATRKAAEQFARELNAAEAGAIAHHNAEQKAFCEQFRAPFIAQSYSVFSPDSEPSETFTLRTYSL